MEDWKSVSSIVPQRTEEECMRIWKRTQTKSCWTEEEEKYLTALVTNYGESNWGLIRNQMMLRFPDVFFGLNDCSHKWHKIKK